MTGSTWMLDTAHWTLDGPDNTDGTGRYTDEMTGTETCLSTQLKCTMKQLSN